MELWWVAVGQIWLLVGALLTRRWEGAWRAGVILFPGQVKTVSRRLRGRGLWSTRTVLAGWLSIWGRLMVPLRWPSRWMLGARRAFPNEAGRSRSLCEAYVCPGLGELVRGWWSASSVSSPSVNWIDFQGTDYPCPEHSGAGSDRLVSLVPVPVTLCRERLPWDGLSGIVRSRHPPRKYN
jgi:hypothetical protein